MSVTTGKRQSRQKAARMDERWATPLRSTKPLRSPGQARLPNHDVVGMEFEPIKPRIRHAERKSIRLGGGS